MIEIRCPCGKALRFAPEMAGRRRKCPACGAEVEVPREGPEIQVMEEARPSAGRGCARHPHARAVGRCTACGAPICAECRGAFGYFCCLEHKGGALPREPIARLDRQSDEDRQAFERSARILRAIKIAVPATVGLVVVVIAALWLLDRGGKVRWELELPRAYPVAVLRAPEGVRVIDADGRIIAVDSGGSRVSEETLEVKPGPSGFIAVFDDVGLVSDFRETTAVSLSRGKKLWSYPAAIGHPRDGDIPRDGDRIFLVARSAEPAEPEGEDPASSSAGPRSFLACLEGRTGKELWKTPVEEGYYGEEIVAGAGHVCLKAVSWNEAEGAKAAITIHSSSDGKPLWKMSTGAEILGGPVLTPHGVVVATPSGLQCLRASDGSRAWSTPVPLGSARKEARPPAGLLSLETADRALKNLWMIDDALILHAGRLLIRVDLSGGKIRWNVDAGAWIQSLQKVGDLLVGSGATDRKLADSAKDGPMFPSDRLMVEILQEEFPDATRAVPFTLAIDARTGTRRWAVPESGRILATDLGLVMYESSAGMALLKPGGMEEQVSVRLVDLSTGKILWTYFLEGCIGKPVAAGTTLYLPSWREAPMSPGLHEAMTAPRDARLIALNMK